MSFFQKVIGALKPGAAKIPLTIGQVRELINADGDDPTALTQLLDSGTCNLDSGGEGEYPVISMHSVVITTLNTYPTILAAMRGKPRRLRALLDHGAGLQVRCGHSRTSLHWAVTGLADAQMMGLGQTKGLPESEQAASLACAQLLLDRGSDVNAVDSLKFTPLHRACMIEGKLGHVRLLLQRGANVDATCSPDGDTPLLVAIKRQLDDVALALLDAGAAPNHTNRKAQGPLHWASLKGLTAVVASLLQRGADPQQPDADGSTPTSLALHSGSLKTLRLVQEAIQRAGGTSALPPQWEVQLFRSAVRTKDEGSLRSLLQALDVNARDEKGIVWWHQVLAKDDTEAVVYLLDHGASLEAETGAGERALHITAHAGKTDTVKLLLARGAAPDTGDWRPLHHAARQGHMEVAQLLLDAGADVNAVAEHWHSPLVLAVDGKHALLVELLADAVDKNGGLAQLPGHSPLNRACELNEPRLVETLLRHRPDPDAPTRDGWTPLHAAVGHGGLELVQLLMDAGANPNAPTEAGYMPLHRAAANGRADLVHLLVKLGADPLRRDIFGFGLEHFTKSSSKTEVSAKVAEVVASAQPLTEDEFRPQIIATLKYHMARAPARLAMLQRQGVDLITAKDARNDVEKSFVVQWPGLATAVAAIYHHLDRKFGPQTLNADGNAAQANSGWVLERVSLEKHPSLHLHRLEIFIPSCGRETVFYDITAAASPQHALAGLLAHSVHQFESGFQSSAPGETARATSPSRVLTAEAGRMANPS